MTKKTEYFCNLCRDKIADITKGEGVYFSAITGIDFKPLHHAENHLCNDCIEKVVDAHTRTN